MTQLAIALLSLVFTAFFAGSETALLASNRIKIRALAKEKHLRAVMAQRVRSNLSRTLSVILVGTNISVVACSVFGTHLFLQKSPRLVVLAPFIITFVILLFGEIIPKSLCLRRPSFFSLWFSVPLVVADKLLQPLAVTIVAGLSFSVLESLLFVPVVYSLFHVGEVVPKAEPVAVEL